MQKVIITPKVSICYVSCVSCRMIISWRDFWEITANGTNSNCSIYNWPNSGQKRNARPVVGEVAERLFLGVCVSVKDFDLSGDLLAPATAPMPKNLTHVSWFGRLQFLFFATFYRKGDPCQVIPTRIDITDRWLPNDWQLNLRASNRANENTPRKVFCRQRHANRSTANALNVGSLSVERL